MRYLFSNRTGWELEENALSKTLQSLKAAGSEIIDLTESNPTRCGFLYPEDIFLKPLAAPDNLLYAPDPKGLPRARQAVAGHYSRSGSEVDPERLVLTSSTSEAYSLLFRLLFEPGDRVLVPAPSYPLFSYLARLNDVEVDYYRLAFSPEGSADGEWRIDLSSLDMGVTSFTKAVILVSPNNPTGSCLKKEEMAGLRDICLRHGLSIICDEVFGDYIAEDYRGRYLSLAGRSEVPTFVLGGLSKTLALPQMKLSWISVSGPQGFVDECLPRLEIICDTYLSVNTPSQNAAAVWLPQAESIQRQVRERVAANYALLRTGMERSGCGQVLPLEGGWYAVMSIPKLQDGEDFALRLLQEKHAFLHPGYFFDFEEEGFLVVSLLPVPAVFNAGVDRLISALREL